VPIEEEEDYVNMVYVCCGKIKNFLNF